MFFHQLRVRVAGGTRQARGEYVREQRLLRQNVSPSASREVKVAVLRQQHQIQLAGSVWADCHRLKTRLIMAVGEGDNRVIIREIVVQW